VKIDRIFYVCFTGYPDRARKMERVAAKASAALGAPAERIWQFPSPWNRWVLDRVPHIGFLDTHPGCFGAGLGQYRAIKTAYELGAQGALFMEDDCRFRKGADIAPALSSAPPDADVLMLDHFADRGVMPGHGWRRADKSASSACYALSRSGMEAILRVYEAPATGEGCKEWRMLRNCDHYTDIALLPNASIYLAFPNLAVQAPCPGGSNCGENHMVSKYARMGIDLKDYDGYDEG